MTPSEQKESLTINIAKPVQKARIIERLEQIAKGDGSSVSAATVRAIEEFVERREAGQPSVEQQLATVNKRFIVLERLADASYQDMNDHHNRLKIVCDLLLAHLISHKPDMTDDEKTGLRLALTSIHPLEIQHLRFPYGEEKDFVAK